jgi:hypothetical protein
MKKKSWFYRFRDGFLTPWWSRYLIVPGLGSGPGVWASYWFAAGNTTLYGYHAPVILLATAIWAGLISAVKSGLDNTAAYSVRQLLKARNELSYLVGLVRGIVAVKSRRFFERGRELRDPVSATEAFMTITQPELQMREIMRGVHNFFTDQSDDPVVERVRVLLMRWDERAGCMEAFNIYFPEAEPPRVPAGAFCDNSTVAGLANEKNDFVIVEDIATDGKFRKFPRGRTIAGSMIAYPVYDDLHRKVVTVINVVSNVPKRFKETERDALEIPMQVFAERLLLENRLLELKERVARGNDGKA